MNTLNQDRIDELESKLTQLRKTPNTLENFDAAKSKQIETLASELTDLKARAKREETYRDDLKRRFLALPTFGTGLDFDRIWSEKLRDTFIAKEITELLSQSTGTHPIYQKGFDD